MKQLQQVTQANRFGSFDKQVSNSDSSSNRFANFQDTLAGTKTTTTTTGRPAVAFQQRTKQDLSLAQDVSRIRQKSPQPRPQPQQQFNTFSNFQARQPAAAHEPRSRPTSATNSSSRGSSLNSVSGSSRSKSPKPAPVRTVDSGGSCRIVPDQECEKVRGPARPVLKNMVRRVCRTPRGETDLALVRKLLKSRQPILPSTKY